MSLFVALTASVSAFLVTKRGQGSTGSCHSASFLHQADIEGARPLVRGARLLLTSKYRVDRSRDLLA